MNKRDEIESGTLSRAADDEPVFVLRGKDELAPDLIDEWATRCNMSHAFREPGVTAAIERKVTEARELAERMREWQRVNGSKLPD